MRMAIFLTKGLARIMPILLRTAGRRCEHIIQTVCSLVSDGLRMCKSERLDCCGQTIFIRTHLTLVSYCFHIYSIFAMFSFSDRYLQLWVTAATQNSLGMIVTIFTIISFKITGIILKACITGWKHAKLRRKKYNN